MQQAPYARSVFWLYTILLDPQKYGIGSRTLLRKYAQENIQTRPLWQPLHLSKAFSNCQRRSCEVAEELNSKALSLPCSVGLIPEDQKKVIDVLIQGCQRSTFP
jgi:perosamine synthetase